MMNPVRAWNTFWFRPISGRPLGAFRVVVGLIMLAHLALLQVDLDYWFGDDGLISNAEARVVAGPLRPSPLQWTRGPGEVRAFMAATAAVAVLFTVGWRTRVMGVLLYAAKLSIHNRKLPANCGADDLLLIALFYLMLSPCGAAYSLDARRAARRRGGTAAEPLVVPWAQRLIQLHVALVYLNTVVLKCHGTTWLDGTALHYVLNNPEVGRFDLSALSRHPVLLNLLSHGALCVEFALPFLLWFRPTRVWAMLGGLALHAGVLFVINVPLFGELTTACYLVFLDPDQLDALFRALNPRRWFRTDPGVTARTPLGVPGRIDPPEAPSGPHAAVAAAAVGSDGRL